MLPHFLSFAAIALMALPVMAEDTPAPAASAEQKQAVESLMQKMEAQGIDTTDLKKDIETMPAPTEAEVNAEMQRVRQELEKLTPEQRAEVRASLEKAIEGMTAGEQAEVRAQHPIFQMDK